MDGGVKIINLRVPVKLAGRVRGYAERRSVSINRAWLDLTEIGLEGDLRNGNADGLQYERSDHSTSDPNPDFELAQILADAIAESYALGSPLTRTGGNGLYRRRMELPDQLRNTTRSRIDRILVAAIGSGRTIRKFVGGRIGWVLCSPEQMDG